MYIEKKNEVDFLNVSEFKKLTNLTDLFDVIIQNFDDNT